MSDDAAERCVLHVAALPFPSQQGTQAAIRAMLEAEARAGRRAELFTYPTSGFDLAPSFALHRSGQLNGSARSRPDPRSQQVDVAGAEHGHASPHLRSGPSWLKLAMDARMGFELGRLIDRLRPRAIVAHHVEAAALVVTRARIPSVFFAHTDLAAELPSYAASGLRPLLRWAGGRLDQFLVHKAGAVASVSSALPLRLGGAASSAQYVPIPWSVPAAIERSERQAARRALGLDDAASVALYAGNLDAYQDPYGMLRALAWLRHEQLPITLLLASASRPDAFLRRAAQLGVNVTSCPLEGEARRRQVHAAADLAIIPRAVPGGLPIKLLDALARGVPCAVSPHAAEGLEDRASALSARDTSSEALACAIATLAQNPALRERLASRGRSYIADHHADQHFVRALDRVLALAARRTALS